MFIMFGLSMIFLHVLHIKLALPDTCQLLQPCCNLLSYYLHLIRRQTKTGGPDVKFVFSSSRFNLVMTNLFKNTFWWSWKPYLMLLFLFGVRIEFCKATSWRSSILTGLFTFISLTSIVMVNYKLMRQKFETYSYFLDLNNDKPLEDRKNVVFSFLFPFVGDIVNLFFSAGPYIIFRILIINGSLQTLWFTLLKVQDAFKLQEKFYLKVRKECYIGLGLVVLVWFYFLIQEDIYINIFNFFQNVLQDILLETCSDNVIVKRRGRSFGLSPLHQIGRVLNILSSTSIRTFFFVASRTAQLLFKEIENMIEDSLSRFKYDEKEYENECNFEICRRHYDTVCKFVDEVNEKFGSILLLNLVWIFYQSLCTFCEMLLSYAYIVIISLQFDLRQMFLSIFLVEFRFHDNYLKNGTVYHHFDDHSPTQALQLYMALEMSSYATILYSTSVLATIWTRLLVILAPATHLKNQVAYIFSIVDIISKCLTKNVYSRDNLYSTACAKSKLLIKNNCFFK